jgi:hypothetical protein
MTFADNIAKAVPWIATAFTAVSFGLSTYEYDRMERESVVKGGYCPPSNGALFLKGAPTSAYLNRYQDPITNATRFELGDGAIVAPPSVIAGLAQLADNSRAVDCPDTAKLPITVDTDPRANYVIVGDTEQGISLEAMQKVREKWMKDNPIDYCVIAINYDTVNAFDYAQVDGSNVVYTATGDLGFAKTWVENLVFRQCPTATKITVKASTK